MNPTTSYVCTRTDKGNDLVLSFVLGLQWCYVSVMHNVHICLSLSLFSYSTLSLKDFINILVYVYKIYVTWNWISTLGLANQFNLLLYQILQNPLFIMLNVKTVNSLLYSFIHSFNSLSYDRSKASSKASSPHSEIQRFLLQMGIFSPFLKVIQ
jgi:hypothetical protein